MNQEFFLKAGTRREMLRAASLLAGGSALAGLLPRTLLAEAQAVPVGVDQHLERRVADPIERLFDFGRDARETRVHEDFPVRAVQDNHVPAGTGEHLNIVSQFQGLQRHTAHLFFHLLDRIGGCS